MSESDPLSDFVILGKFCIESLLIVVFGFRTLGTIKVGFEVCKKSYLFRIDRYLKEIPFILSMSVMELWGNFLKVLKSGLKGVLE